MEMKELNMKVQSLHSSYQAGISANCLFRLRHQGKGDQEPNNRQHQHETFISITEII
jgi:uncharacterized lipoprotein YmbA